MSCVINVNRAPKIIFIGNETENDARRISFDLSAWVEEFGAGTAQLLIKRPGEAEAYSVLLTVNNGKADWLPSSTDTAIAGTAEISLAYSVGTVAIRTGIIFAVIDASIATGTTPPPGLESWVEQLGQLAEDAQTAAANAEAAKDDAEAAAASVEGALQQIEQNKDDISALKSASYNLLDPTGITPYQSTSVAELTRTGFVIKNTTEATYSRGYLYLTLKPNTEYTFSAKKHTTSGVGFVGYAEAPAEGEAYPSASTALVSRTDPDDETIIKTFTTTTGILIIRFYATWDTAELGKVEYSEIMVIEGAEAKPFVRHVFAQDDEARNAVNDPQTGLDQKAGILRNTVSGAIVSFTPDASVKDLLGLTVAVEPVQDLHGYESPWPAGGGKNKLDAESTFTNPTTSLVIKTLTLKPNTQYTASTNRPIGSGTTAGTLLADMTETLSTGTCGFWNGTSRTKTTDENGQLRIAYRLVDSETAATFLAYNYQLEEGSSSTSFAPYSNICPISGWTGANVTMTGENLLDISEYETTEINGITFEKQTDGGIHVHGTASMNTRTKVFISCTLLAEKTYTFGKWKNAGSIQQNAFNAAILGYTSRIVGEANQYLTFTTSTDQSYTEFAIFVASGTTVNNIFYPQIEIGSAPTDFKPYVAQTVTSPFGQTVYGGTLDVTTGKLTVTMASVDLGTLAWASVANNRWNSNGIRSTAKYPADGYTVTTAIASNYKAYANEVLYQNTDLFGFSVHPQGYLLVRNGSTTDTPTGQLVYELATPQTYQLTPQQIETIKGQINNVWADAGNVAVEFAEDVKTYIDNKFAELQALALENN